MPSRPHRLPSLMPTGTAVRTTVRLRDQLGLATVTVTAGEAVARRRKVRPSIIIRSEAMEALHNFAIREHLTIRRDREFDLAMQNIGL